MGRSREFNVRAGDLRHILTIQTYTSTQSASGSPVVEWLDKAHELWGEVRPLSAKEVSDGDRVTGRATHRIQIRSDFSISHNDRVKFGDRYFNIESIRLIDEISKTYVIIAQEDLDT